MIKYVDNTTQRNEKNAKTYKRAIYNGEANGTMSADIFKRKMAPAIQLKWTFLALKWAVFCLKMG
jgi:hypothetical protein